MTVLGTSLLVERPVAPIRRVVENFSAGFLATLTPMMRKWAAAQAAMDAKYDRFAPSLEEGHFENVPGYGRLWLGELVSAGPYTTVFFVKNKVELLIKYQSNCMSPGSPPQPLQPLHWVHPLLRDYWLAKQAEEYAEKLANDTGTDPVYPTAKVYFVSPAGRMMANLNRKVEFINVNARACAKAGGVIRFIVMERLEKCVASGLRTAEIAPQVAIFRSLQLIHTVQRLHAAGVVHGDIHQGNVCQRQSTPEQITLIDLGNGVFVDMETEELRSLPTKGHIYRNPWELEGHRPARRDDMYNSLYLGAMLMIGWVRLEKHTSKLLIGKPGAPVNTRALLHWKRNEYIFRTPTFDPLTFVSGLTPDEKVAVETQLASVVEYANALPTAPEAIDYEFVKAALTHAVEILQASAATEKARVASSTEAAKISGVDIHVGPARATVP